jgi:hypothetical protein
MARGNHAGISRAKESFKTILEKLDGILTSAIDIKDWINSSDVTARKYVAVLKETGTVEHCMVKEPKNGQNSTRILSRRVDVTDEVLSMLQQYMFKKYVDKYKYHDDEEEVIHESSDSARVFRLSTNPSQYFVDKFKAQNEQARDERKSPRAYAGTSAGMVW